MLVLSVLALLLTTVNLDAASASNWNGQCQGGYSLGPCRHHDDSPEFWWSGTLNQNWRDAGNYAKGRLDFSDVDPVNVANAQNTGVWTYQGNYGDVGWNGATLCADVNGSQQCRRSSVYANNFYISFTQDQREALFCHEFGHTVGLLHKAHSGDGSCIESNSHWHRDYDSHDRGHLNDHYAP